MSNSKPPRIFLLVPYIGDNSIVEAETRKKLKIITSSVGPELVTLANFVRASSVRRE